MDSLPTDMTSLCFNRQEFVRLDFNTDRFITQARGHVTLEHLKDHLHLYLKILQNSMIELINKDYADFVNLSSNLVSLKNTVKKLDKDLICVDDELRDQLKQMTDATTELSVSIELKHTLLTDQANIQKRIECMRRMGHLQRLLDTTTSLSVADRCSSDVARRSAMMLGAIKSTLQQLDDVSLKRQVDGLVNVFQSKFDKLFCDAIRAGNSEMVKVLLDAYSVANRIEAALAIFISEIVEPRIVECLKLTTDSKRMSKSDETFQQFGVFLETLLQIFDDNSLVFTECKKMSFLFEATLTLLHASLRSQFSALLVSSDPDAFHVAFSRFQAFLVNFSSKIGVDVKLLNTHSMVRTIRTQFSFNVYCQLRAQNLHKAIDVSCNECVNIGKCNAVLVKNSFELVYNLNENEILNLPATRFAIPTFNTFLDQTIWLWSDEVFIGSIGEKFIEMQVSLLNRYVGWFGSFLNNTVKFGDCESLVMLLADSQRFEATFWRIFSSRIWSLLSKLCTDSGTVVPEKLLLLRLFEQIFLSVNEFQTSMGNSIETCVIAIMSQRLVGVGEIPRQYRWTRKEEPTEESVYVGNAVDPLNAIVAKAVKGHLNNELVIKIVTTIVTAVTAQYENSIDNVLVSVDKISSSLSRLKKSNTRSGALSEMSTSGAHPLTDDDKIRRQLQLDVSKYIDLIENITINYFIFDSSSLFEKVSQTKHSSDNPK